MSYTVPHSPAPVGMPQEVKTARILLWIQGGLGALGSIIFLIGMAALVGYLSVAGPLILMALIFGFIGIVMTILFLICAATAPQGRKWTLYAIIVAEVLSILGQIVNIANASTVGNNIVFSLLGLAIAIGVLVSVLSARGKAFFVN